MKKFFLDDAPLGQTGTSVILLLLRVFIGILMLTHGWAKLSNFENLFHTFSDPIGMGSEISLILTLSAEVGCSVLLILGVFTRLVTLPLAFTMCVAIFIVHANDPFAVKELPMLYLSIYTTLFFLGGGRYSLSRIL